MKNKISNKKNIFSNWLDTSTEKCMITLKKIGIATISAGPLLLFFGLALIILGIYSFSEKAPSDPHIIQIFFYIDLGIYIFVYIGVFVLALFLVPAFRVNPKIKIIVAVTLFTSFLLIPSLALVVMGKYFIYLSKYSNNEQQTLTPSQMEQITNEVKENLPNNLNNASLITKETQDELANINDDVLDLGTVVE